MTPTIDVSSGMRKIAASDGVDAERDAADDDDANDQLDGFRIGSADEVRDRRASANATADADDRRDERSAVRRGRSGRARAPASAGEAARAGSTVSIHAPIGDRQADPGQARDGPAEDDGERHVDDAPRRSPAATGVRVSCRA